MDFPKIGILKGIMQNPFVQFFLQNASECIIFYAHQFYTFSACINPPFCLHNHSELLVTFEIKPQNKKESYILARNKILSRLEVFGAVWGLLRQFVNQKEKHN